MLGTAYRGGACSLGAWSTSFSVTVFEGAAGVESTAEATAFECPSDWLAVAAAVVAIFLVPTEWKNTPSAPTRAVAPVMSAAMFSGVQALVLMLTFRTVVSSRMTLSRHARYQQRTHPACQARTSYRTCGTSANRPESP